MATSLSVIIPTKGRVEGLRRLLESLRHLHGRESISHEVIVVDGAPDEATARVVEDIVKGSSSDPGNRLRYLWEPRPGMSLAINRAVSLAQGFILAVLHDDVEASPEWLRATEDFFRKHSFDAMQGAVLFPPGLQDNAEFLSRWNRYKTINYVNLGKKVKEIKSLTGTNIAVKREVFDRVGLFDERLGPGRSGMSEDVEFAQRLLKSGGRIGYEPGAAVYHEVDWERFTESFFRLRHEQQGRSRLIYKKNSVSSIILNLMRSAFAFGWFSLAGNERRKYRAKGRTYHYRAMLREKIKRAAGHQQ